MEKKNTNLEYSKYQDWHFSKPWNRPVISNQPNTSEEIKKLGEEAFKLREELAFDFSKLTDEQIDGLWLYYGTIYHRIEAECKRRGLD